MLNFVHYQPWPLMNRLHRELDQAFNRPASGSEAAVGTGAGWTPSVDVHEQSDGFLVRADIPGVAPSDIEVTAEDGVLTIRGVRKVSETVGGSGFENIEREFGAFLRRFTLPDVANAADIKANYANGVLEVRIPKVPRLEAKRISVTVN
jgi:HSP20 family protein